MCTSVPHTEVTILQSAVKTQVVSVTDLKRALAGETFLADLDSHINNAIILADKRGRGPSVPGASRASGPSKHFLRREDQNVSSERAHTRRLPTLALSSNLGERWDHKHCAVLT